MNTSDSSVVVLDGSQLEGGGQLLRNAIALSALLSRPVSIHDIRGKRASPGLKHQHAAGLRLVAEICSADIAGCKVGARSIDFRPTGPLQVSKSYTADPKTAGSIALLLQVSLPCLLFSPSPAPPSELVLRGGTNATQAPQIDYVQYVFLPFLRSRFGLEPDLRVLKRGYYPKGGGEVRVTLPPVQRPLPCVDLTTRGPVTAVRGRSYVAGLPKHLAESMRRAAQAVLVEAGIEESMINIEAIREDGRDVIGAGSGIVLWAETEQGCIIGGSAIGRKGIAPDVVGKDAALELTRNLAHGGCVDEYLQDQIIIFLALAQGHSTVKTGPLTLHTRTAIWVIEQLSEAKFQVRENEDGSTVIECDGIGRTANAS